MSREHGAGVSPRGSITEAKPVRVAAFTGGATISSPRFRVRQYIPGLGRYGIQVSEYIARFGSWPPSSKSWRPFWLPATISQRVPGVIGSFRYDVTLLQREMVSTLVTLEGLTHRPRILDVDDAVWLNRGGEKNFSRLVQLCDGVICGNSFIEDTIRRWHSQTIIVPTGVDTERFRPLEGMQRPKPVIGWSGLGTNLKSLAEIERPLAAVLNHCKDAVLRIVSNVKPRFELLPAAQVEYIPWSPENEVRTIQEMSVGLMPAEDSLWARGKCSYKMLLYLSCGVPAVVSPVGMNQEVLSLGRVGFGPRSETEWTDCLISLLENPEQAQQMGENGRRVVEEQFSLHVLTPRLAGYIRTFCK